MFPRGAAGSVFANSVSAVTFLKPLPRTMRRDSVSHPRLHIRLCGCPSFPPRAHTRGETREFAAIVAILHVSLGCFLVFPFSTLVSRKVETQSS